MNCQIILSIDNAIKLLAKGNRDEFGQFLDRYKDFDAKPVQRLLCRGLVEAAEQVADLALDFLVSDRRRLSLGGYQDYHGDTRALIRAVADHLTPEQLGRLEAAIVNWSDYVGHIQGEDAATRFDRKKWNREKRLRLLKTLPIDRLSSDTQALIRSEEVALPDYRDYDHERIRGMIKVGSPMSSEQMARARDEDVLNLFEELIDDTGEGRSRDFGRRGTVEASQELARLAVKDPHRVAQLLRQLRPADQQTPAAFAIRALGDNDEYPTVQLFDLIRELDRTGFQGADFRSEAAHACLIRANKEDGLPEDMCALLEEWLTSWKEWNYFHDKEDEREQDEQTEPRSVLGNHFSMILPHGSYWLLHALTYGYLRQQPPKYDKWLASLERHLKRPEAIYVWKVLTEDLRFLPQCDHARATEFLTQLFERYPSVRDSHFGVVLLLRCRFFLDSGVYQRILSSIRESAWVLGKQAFGELLGISYLFREFNDWIESEVDRWVDDPKVAVGLAFTTGRVLWEDAAAREKGVALFERLAPAADDRLAKALMSTFVNQNALPAHPDSRRLLQAVSANSRLLVSAPEHWFVEKLEDVITYCPDLVCTISNQIVDIWAQQLSNVATSVSLASSNLVNIAMTLQRLHDYRDRGLALFERLLELGVYDAASLLKSLDCRPLNVPKRRHRRRGSRR